MIQLCADWLAATLHVISRISRRAASPTDSPPVVDGVAQPAGVGVSSSDSAAGTGGHPHWVLPDLSEFPPLRPQLGPHHMPEFFGPHD